MQRVIISDPHLLRWYGFNGVVPVEMQSSIWIDLWCRRYFAARQGILGCR
jgi:hypothetical protein